MKYREMEKGQKVRIKARAREALRVYPSAKGLTLEVAEVFPRSSGYPVMCLAGAALPSLCGESGVGRFQPGELELVK